MRLGSVSWSHGEIGEGRTLDCAAGFLRSCCPATVRLVYACVIGGGVRAGGGVATVVRGVGLVVGFCWGRWEGGLVVVLRGVGGWVVGVQVAALCSSGCTVEVLLVWSWGELLLVMLRSKLLLSRWGCEVPLVGCSKVLLMMLSSLRLSSVGSIVGLLGIAHMLCVGIHVVR